FSALSSSLYSLSNLTFTRLFLGGPLLALSISLCSRLPSKQPFSSSTPPPVHAACAHVFMSCHITWKLLFWSCALLSFILITLSLTLTFCLFLSLFIYSVSLSFPFS